MLKKIFITGGLTFGLASWYDWYSQAFVFKRNLRTIACGLHILYGYKIQFDQDNYMQVHESIAKDIFQTCLQNDGLYVKFGQGIAANDHMLPPPFYKHLSKLQDKAKETTYELISQVFEEEQGRKIEEVFLSFQKKPIASASLAQVHKATLKDGRAVAVKIQKPQIKKQFKSDMAMHYIINWVLQYAFQLPLLHFVNDIEVNLKKELDFTIEADNSIRGMEDFKKLKRDELYVPQVIPEFTRTRVLVTQWVDAFKITDSQNLNRLKFNKKSIMNDLIRAFSQQIFISGFIHCDPHPGNVFVRPNPKNPSKHQIVILDFGLCISVSEHFRKSYASFWRSMFIGDTQTMQKVCNTWGMKFRKEFANFQLMKPYNKSNILHNKVQTKDVIEMQLAFKGKLKELMQETIHYPRELIFIARNMNLVRSLNKYYGGIADRIAIMSKAAYIGSNMDFQHNKRGGKASQLKFYWQNLRFSIHIWILQFIDWIASFFGKSLDNFVDQGEAKIRDQMFQKYKFKKVDSTTFNA